MVTGWVALVTTALGLIATVLGLVVKNKETKEAKTCANDIPKFDQALAERNTDTLSTQFDELRLPTDGEGNTSRPDDQKPA